MKDFTDCTCITKIWADKFIKVQIGSKIIVTTHDHKFETEGKGEIFGYNLQKGDKIIVSEELP